MDGKRLTCHLRALCEALDSAGALDWRLWRRLLAPIGAPALVAGTLGLGGCPSPEPVAVYGAPPMIEICNDGIDNDGDGLVDCQDDGCASDDACGAVPGCAIIHPEICDDRGDNDGNGLVDCQDPSCAGDPACAPTATLYGAPPATVEICGDGVDNDGDGHVDCLDSDCAGRAICGPQVDLYGAPPMAAEVCGDGVDNDRDGRVDCSDDECATHATCAAVPAYGAPPPGPPPPRPRYRAPFPRD